MSTNTIMDGRNSLILRRPVMMSGFFFEVDPAIKAHLDEINSLLSKKIFEANVDEEQVRQALNKRLDPKRSSGQRWEARSLAHYFNNKPAADDKLSLGDYIDRHPALSALKGAFEEKLNSLVGKLENNTKAVLEYAGIRDYLLARGFLVMNLQEINGLRNFVMGNAAGAKDLVNYAIVSAARTVIAQERFDIDDANNDNSEIVRQIRAADLSISTAKFKTNLRALLKNFLFNSVESQIIAAAEAVIGPIPPRIKPQLIKMMKSSPVPITTANANFFLPLLITQILGTTESEAPAEVDLEQADRDFEVKFLEDDNSLIEVSRSAVRCASQLYYTMVLGEELDVFNIVNYFTHKYLIRGGMEILDGRLRDDLQRYVFSNKFTDLKTKRVEERTRPGERHMFYRQVFNLGKGQITEDVIVNTEFPRLWRVLMLEAVNYIERSQSSFNASAIPKGKVMQAVEDLQYNLSTHCTGMANVIAPLIHGELDFVIRRIFMHPEVLRQLVPQGGTWWRVVEILYMGLKHSRPKSTVIYNKAKQGNKIIRTIAEYNPSSFEDDTEFNNFISDIDAYITTQSILQESLEDAITRADREEEEEAATNGYHTNGNGYRRAALDEEAVSAAAPAAAGAGGDEWDF